MAEPTRREHLEALRAILRGQLEDAPASAVAAIAREFRATLAELASIGPGVNKPAEEGSTVDDLSARRASRQRSATPTD